MFHPIKRETLSKQGFTIVELLVVIVVIGVLATITIVSYTGINNKAIVSSLQSDLSVSAKQFKLYNVEYGTYPIGNTKEEAFDSNNCPLQPADTKYCLKLSGGNTIESYAGTTSSFTLATKHGDNIIWEITNDSQPASIVPVPLTAASTTGTAEEDSILTATTTPAGAATTATFQWQRADNAGFTTNLTNIGTNSSNYTLLSADVNKYIRVKVTGTTRFPGEVYSNGVGPVVIYPWMTIGTQTWAKANVNVGTTLLDFWGGWPADNSIIEKWCTGNNLTNCASEGGIYGWNEAMQYSTTPGAQGICPAGSHIPTDTEFKTLEKYLGMTQGQADNVGFRGTNQGTQMKPAGSSGLNILVNINYYVGDDATGYQWGSLAGALWSSTQGGYYNEGWFRMLDVNENGVSRATNDFFNGPIGISVRCLKN